MSTFHLVFLGVDSYARRFALAAGLPGDYNQDGTVDSLDYNVWQANFGAMLPSASSVGSAAVPEPSTGLLVVLLALAMARHNRTANL